MAGKKDDNLFSKMFFSGVKIQDVMRSPVITVYEDDELSIVGEKFTIHNVSYLPVINHSNELIGLISQKYLYKTLSPRKIIGHEELDYDPQMIIDGDAYYNKESLDSYILRNVMKKDPVTLGAEDSVAEAIATMDKRNISCIPIIDGKRKVIGLVTFHEVMKYLAKMIG